MEKSGLLRAIHLATPGTIFAIMAVLFISPLVQTCARILLDLLLLHVLRCMGRTCLFKRQLKLKSLLHAMQRKACCSFLLPLLLCSSDFLFLVQVRSIADQVARFPQEQ